MCKQKGNKAKGEKIIALYILNPDPHHLLLVILFGISHEQLVLEVALC